MTKRSNYISKGAAGGAASGVALAAALGIVLGFGGVAGAEPAVHVVPPPAPVIDLSSIIPVSDTAADTPSSARQPSRGISWTDESDFNFKQIQKTIREVKKQTDKLVVDGVNELSKYITGATSPKALAFTLTALEQLGKPYVWAAVGPDSFDCSGLIVYAANKHGISVPRVAVDQANSGTLVTRDQLRPGDLVEYNGGDHIGIYLGGNKTLHAPQAGDVVKIQDTDQVGSIVKYTRIA